MAEYWEITCKDCGKEFEYSDYILQMEINKGLSRPERCKDCRTRHKREIKEVGNSHFELIPLKESPSILGTPFIGMIDHKERKIERLDVPDESKTMDLGLKDEEETTIKEIYKEIDKHQVIIIVAATGTGKSTYLPFRLAFPLIYDNNKDLNKYLRYGPIVVTQPRKIATEGIANAIAKNLCKTFVGEGFEIGFKYSDKEDYSFRNRLIFATDGSLLNWISQGRIGQFSAIIIDEAHERSKNIDVILSLIKHELPKYPYLKIIVLSATIDSKSFEDFFTSILKENQVKVLDYTADKYAIKKFKYEEADGWRWAELDLETGIEYEQTEKDLSEANRALKEYVREAPLKTAHKIVDLLKKDNSSNGILAFLPGVQEIHACIEEIKNLYQIDYKIRLFALHSGLSEKERDKAAEPFGPDDMISENGQDFYPRRVVVATNIAETSITFDDIVHVIDSGLIKQSYWDSKSCTQFMKIQFHSKDGCKQRWGRAGRKMDGFVYRLYPKEWFVRYFPHHTSPEIERCCLDDVFLKSIENGVTDVNKLTWLTQPDSAEFARVQNLLSKRALLDVENDLTEDGSEILKLQKQIGKILQEYENNMVSLSLDIATLLLYADKYGCLIEAVALATAFPHVGASMFALEGDNKEMRSIHNGFFVWNENWDLITKDYFNRLYGDMKIGCVDDLDFVFKLCTIFDQYSTDGAKESTGFIMRNMFSRSSIDKYLDGREKLLDYFARNISEKSIRSVNYKQIDKLRLIMPLIFPDKLGKILKLNGFLIFEDNIGNKFILSPNIAGAWEEGDKAICLLYKKSSFVIEKDSEKILENSLTSPYAEFLIRVKDAEIYNQKEIRSYDIIEFLKNEAFYDINRLKKMFTPIIAFPESKIIKNPLGNSVAASEIINRAY